jgi:type VI secretion system (T6SS) baseplate-like injector VgrG
VGRLSSIVVFFVMTVLMTTAASAGQDLTAVTVAIGGVRVAPEVQLRVIVEQQLDAADHAQIRIAGPLGVEYGRSIVRGQAVEIVVVAVDGVSTPIFTGAVASTDTVYASGEAFVIVDAFSAQRRSDGILQGSVIMSPDVLANARVVDFAPRLSATSSIQTVVVTGVTEPTGEPISGAAVAPAIALVSDSGDWSGATISVETDQRFASPEDANAFARVVLTGLLDKRVSAEVLTNGHADIRAGSLVDINGIGPAFEGKYRVTGVQHRIGGDSYGGYSTSLRLRRVDFGMFHHPAIDGEVLVAFQGGDTSRPYVVGSLWDCGSSTRSSDDDPRCRLIRWPW